MMTEIISLWLCGGDGRSCVLLLGVIGGLAQPLIPDT
jgi:hypothetical protein